MLKALCSDYALFAFSTAKTLIVLPILLLWLGPEEYGAWAMAVAAAGYLDLCNFSVAGSVIRRVSAAAGAVESGAADASELRRAQASGSALFLALGLALAFLGVALSAALPWFLPGDAPEGLVVTARLTLLVCAARVALGTALQIHASILYARKRLHELFAIQGFCVLLSLVATLWVVARGEGILWLATVNLLCYLPEPLWCWVSARRRFPEGAWGARDASMEESRRMLEVGGWLAVSSAVGLVHARTLPLLVGWTSGLGAVTLLDANQRLWQMGLLLLRKIPNVLWPSVSASLGEGRADAALRRLKAMALPTLALGAAGCAGFGAFARETLVGWVGLDQWDGWTLAICLGALTFLKVVHHSLHLAFLSAGKTAAPAVVGLAEFLLMAALLPWMALEWGVAGAVAGALAANLATTAWFSAWYFCHVYGLNAAVVAGRGLRMAASCALPALATALALRWALEPRTSLFLGAALGGVSAGVGLACGLAFGVDAARRQAAIALAKRMLAARRPAAVPTLPSEEALDQPRGPESAATALR